jgi:hypothetical protein
MNTTKRGRIFRILGVTALALTLVVLFTGCGGIVLVGGGLALGGFIGTQASPVFGTIIGGLIGGFIAFYIYSIIDGGGSSDDAAKALIIALASGHRLSIKDGYILGPNGNKLGSIVGSVIYTQGRKFGTIKGNDVYNSRGDVICHIGNGYLVQ